MTPSEQTNEVLERLAQIRRRLDANFTPRPEDVEWLAERLERTERERDEWEVTAMSDTFDLEREFGNLFAARDDGHYQKSRLHEQNITAAYWRLIEQLEASGRLQVTLDEFIEEHRLGAEGARKMNMPREEQRNLWVLDALEALRTAARAS